MVFTLLLLSAMYGIVILGLVLLLRKMGVSRKRAIILSFLVFGAVTGINPHSLGMADRFKHIL